MNERLIALSEGLDDVLEFRDRDRDGISGGAATGIGIGAGLTGIAAGAAGAYALRKGRRPKLPKGSTYWQRPRKPVAIKKPMPYRPSEELTGNTRRRVSGRKGAKTRAANKAAREAKYAGYEELRKTNYNKALAKRRGTPPLLSDHRRSGNKGSRFDKYRAANTNAQGRQKNLVTDPKTGKKYDTAGWSYSSKERLTYLNDQLDGVLEMATRAEKKDAKTAKMLAKKQAKMAGYMAKKGDTKQAAEARWSRRQMGTSGYWLGPWGMMGNLGKQQRIAEYQNRKGNG